MDLSGMNRIGEKEEKTLPEGGQRYKFLKTQLKTDTNGKRDL